LTLDVTNPEIQFALRTVRQAARLVRQVREESNPSSLTKGDRSPVTVADFASQALVAWSLSQAYPADPLVAEEDASALRAPGAQAILDLVTGYVRQVLPEADSSQVCRWIDRGAADPGGRFWTLDPIDGTKGFLRGDQYVVALALVVEARVALAFLGCPNLTLSGGSPGAGCLVVAARGQGTWVTGMAEGSALERLAVSERQDPAQARLLRSFESGHTNADMVDELGSQLGVEADPVRMDSQAKYAVLAGGGGELLVRLLSPTRPDYREKIWDQAAGSLILEEAGGRITDLDGRSLDFSTGRSLAGNRGVLASNGHLHDLALNALRVVGA
jgi:3'(2'), 5'-bisphosphate nucleotidase